MMGDGLMLKWPGQGVVVSPVIVGGEGGEQRRAGRDANRVRTICAVETDAGAAQRIEVRRYGYRVAIDGHRMWLVLIRHQEQHGLRTASGLGYSRSGQCSEGAGQELLASHAEQINRCGRRGLPVRRASGLQAILENEAPTWEERRSRRARRPRTWRVRETSFRAQSLDQPVWNLPLHV